MSARRAASTGRLVCVLHRCLKRICQRVNLFLRCHPACKQCNRLLAQRHHLCIGAALGFCDQVLELACIRNQTDIGHRRGKLDNHRRNILLGRIGRGKQRICPSQNLFKDFPVLILNVVFCLVRMCFLRQSLELVQRCRRNQIIQCIRQRLGHFVDFLLQGILLTC